MPCADPRSLAVQRGAPSANLAFIQGRTQDLRRGCEIDYDEVMRECDCTVRHQPKRIVLTGGPGAGKTAVLELVRQAFCRHVVVLSEAAGILFGGGFPRGPSEGERAVAQR